MAFDTFRRLLIVETGKAWLEVYPAAGRRFAQQLKREKELQNKGGAWTGTKAGYKKYSLPRGLWLDLLEVFKHYDVQPTFGVDDADVRVLAQEFPDFLTHMNIDTNPRTKDRRPKTLITPGK